jgi:protein-S-isoprenylcysteine O-methyltransferase Ste14
VSTIKLIVLLAGTSGMVWVSRRSLKNPRSHGFFRFFAWEAILVLFVLNVNYWIIDPFSPTQIIAWVLLILSLVLIASGVQQFRRQGKPDPGRSDDPALVGIEKTTQLVTTGLYRYIRHPFYSSLLFLGWGIFFKHPAWAAGALAAAATAFLVFTAKREETENLIYFGVEYREYMKHTKMFIPFLF